MNDLQWWFRIAGCPQWIPSCRLHPLPLQRTPFNTNRWTKRTEEEKGILLSLSNLFFFTCLCLCVRVSFFFLRLTLQKKKKTRQTTAQANKWPFKGDNVSKIREEPGFTHMYSRLITVDALHWNTSDNSESPSHTRIYQHLGERCCGRVAIHLLLSPPDPPPLSAALPVFDPL